MWKGWGRSGWIYYQIWIIDKSKKQIYTILIRKPQKQCPSIICHFLTSEYKK